MKKCDLSRREFNRLTVAAFGGVVAGSLAGCSDDPPPAPAPAPAPAPPTDPVTPADVGTPTDTDGEDNLLMGEKHVCRGLTMCKGQGGGGGNDCAGTGACATLAEHKCSGDNACKGQGGCGEKPGENACKGKGGCAVPLKHHAWEKARANFTAAMKAAGKEVGPSPAAPEKS